MRVSYYVFFALTTLLACSETVAATSNKHPNHDETVHDKNKRLLRSNPENYNTAAAEDDEEDRDLLIPTVDRPKYHRWFHAHMTPYDVKEVLGLTGVRRFVKPIKRRVYKGYVVYYEEHCREPEYRHLAFCQVGTGK
ncbi:putative secreted RxLR effector protein [Phytophthora cinnamomi]|uniref:putative secreted RxLR effector protein n=1 Tax=Phytophthora cinnamomi TaxID=4785 RepID=UPI002A351663|nr:putative secreted RxLR effector protein [Phytophthora cinnamomi]KAG6610564.1 putative secreted RxLR effector protein [Phytophthora cinnamomi]KAJ8554947.1 hypothetical protein ON010_g9534 [Phytophthora cinnamomi]QVE55517.1 RxLR effector protein 4a [Phytophthora cinnamomi]QVE55518.1 RxLR effector protein 4b [Phytophthora cinnamomi]